MTVRYQQLYNYGLYFITYTCYKWLNLFHESDAYDLVYKWFDHLKTEGSYIVAYVIMPNHVHVIISFRNNGKSINTRVGNGKRFIAYGIIQQLEKLGKTDLLRILSSGVSEVEKRKGKLHRVFEPSFDCKEIHSDAMLSTKLDYIHNNPCQGKWMLAESTLDYVHSSAYYYSTGVPKGYAVVFYKNIEEIDISVPLLSAASSTRDTAGGGELKP